MNHNDIIDGEKKASSPVELNQFAPLELFFVNGTGGVLNFIDTFDVETLRNIVKDPMENNEILRKMSLMLYGENGAFTNTVDYMASMPTLSNVIVIKGKNKKRGKKNKEIMIDVLDAIRHKEIVRDALFKGMIEGVAFYYFETENRPLSKKKILTDYDIATTIEINNREINASIISLPTDYTRIVGIKNSSYVLAFNLQYFVDASGEQQERKLRKYPKEIRDAFHNNGGTGWVVLDNSKTIVHKIRSKRDERWGRPLVLAAINDILYSDYFTDTKRGVLDEMNNRIIYQTLPEGVQKGTSALTKPQQEKQHERVKTAIMKKNTRGGTSFFSVAAGTKITAIDTANTTIFDDKNENSLNDKIALDLGLASSLLNGVGAGSFSTASQNLELVTAQIMGWISQIESELNKCINANIIKDKNNPVQCKYLPITHVNKEKMVTYAKDLYLQGKGSLSMWAAAAGIDPDIFYALLDEELEEDIENKYPVHSTSFTVSDKKNGRPKSDNPDDRTVQSQQNDGNNIPSPSD